MSAIEYVLIKDGWRRNFAKEEERKELLICLNQIVCRFT
jgi:hypothetical protein